MKPYVICHMGSSVDGRTLPSRWRPGDSPVGAHYERAHERLEGDAWLVGRVTGQEFGRGSGYPPRTQERYARERWIAQREAKSYGIVLDTKGSIAWARSEIGGDPIVVILTEQVSDAHLAGLREDEVSYLFAGRTSIDLALTLEVLNAELGIERLLLEGGGTINGAFLRAGLVDEISLILMPTIDGAKGAPSIFDSVDARSGPAPIESMNLEYTQTLDDGALWLRYRIRNR